MIPPFKRIQPLKNLWDANSTFCNRKLLVPNQLLKPATNLWNVVFLQCCRTALSTISGCSGSYAREFCLFPVVVVGRDTKLRMPPREVARNAVNPRMSNETALASMATSCNSWTDYGECCFVLFCVLGEQHFGGRFGSNDWR